MVNLAMHDALNKAMHKPEIEARMLQLGAIPRFSTHPSEAGAGYIALLASIESENCSFKKSNVTFSRIADAFLPIVSVIPSSAMNV